MVFCGKPLFLSRKAILGDVFKKLSNSHDAYKQKAKKISFLEIFTNDSFTHIWFKHEVSCCTDTFLLKKIEKRWEVYTVHYYFCSVR